MTYPFVCSSVTTTPAELAPVETLFMWPHYSRSVISVFSAISDLHFALTYVLSVLHVSHVLLD
jgi:hypothetical protein